MNENCTSAKHIPTAITAGKHLPEGRQFLQCVCPCVLVLTITPYICAGDGLFHSFDEWRGKAMYLRVDKRAEYIKM